MLNTVLQGDKKEKGNGSWQTFCQNLECDVTHALQFLSSIMINVLTCVRVDLYTYVMGTHVCWSNCLQISLLLLLECQKYSPVSPNTLGQNVSLLSRFR